MSRALYHALALLCTTPVVRRYGFPSGNVESGTDSIVPNTSETVSTRFDNPMGTRTTTVFLDTFGDFNSSPQLVPFDVSSQYNVTGSVMDYVLSRFGRDIVPLRLKLANYIRPWPNLTAYGGNNLHSNFAWNQPSPIWDGIRLSKAFTSTSSLSPARQASPSSIVKCFYHRSGSDFVTANGFLHVKACLRFLEELVLFCIFNPSKDATFSILICLFWFMTTPRVWAHVASQVLRLAGFSSLCYLRFIFNVAATVTLGTTHAALCICSIVATLSHFVARLVLAVPIFVGQMMLLQALCVTMLVTDLSLSSIVALHSRTLAALLRLDRVVAHCRLWHADWLATVRPVVTRAINGASKKCNQTILPRLPTSWERHATSSHDSKRPLRGMRARVVCCIVLALYG